MKDADDMQENDGLAPETEAEEIDSPRTALSVFMLFAALITVFGIAIFGGTITATSVNDWYPGLVKPAFTPPGWVFPIVWNLLYFLMALAAWLVWLKAGSLKNAGAPLSLFGSQLMLNLGWSVLFFGLQSPGGALIEVLVLLLVVAVTTVTFFRRSPLAGILMSPYLAWVGFASYLNAGVWLLNG